MYRSLSVCLGSWCLVVGVSREVSGPVLHRGGAGCRVAGRFFCASLVSEFCQLAVLYSRALLHDPGDWHLSRPGIAAVDAHSARGSRFQAPCFTCFDI